jgi:ketosteroid isomerase-like protein
MGDVQQRNLAAARAFYDTGPAASDEQRRAFFASGFTWHVPGDTDLSGPYVGEDFFTRMPARMQPLDQWDLEIHDLGANEDLVVAVGRVRGRRLGRSIEAVCGHVLRYDSDSRIVEAWGWCSDQRALAEFFA